MLALNLCTSPPSHLCERLLDAVPFPRHGENYDAPPPTFLHDYSPAIRNRAARFSEKSKRHPGGGEHDEVSRVRSYLLFLVVSVAGLGRMWSVRLHSRGSRGFSVLASVPYVDVALLSSARQPGDRKSRYPGVVRVNRGARIVPVFPLPLHSLFPPFDSPVDSLEVARAVTPAENKGFPFGDRLV